MIDIVSNSIQTVAAGEGIVFETPRIKTGCSVRHEAGSARFILLKPGIYLVLFTGNIAVPAGGTAGPISVALSVDGENATGSDAIYTPAAVDEYGNVSISRLVRVYGTGCCAQLVVVNSADVDINVQDANLIITDWR